VPNYSCRMDNLRASLLRPQLADLDRQCRRWNERYDHLAHGLKEIPGIFVPDRNEKEDYVGSSIQFSLNGRTKTEIQGFLDRCRKLGVELKWFGNYEPVAFTSTYESWQYLGDLPDLPNTKRILAVMCDMRIPLTFSLEDCDLILEIISDMATELFG